MKLESSNRVKPYLAAYTVYAINNTQAYGFTAGVIIYGALYFPSIVLGSNIFEATRGVRLVRYRG